jgi:hypothetical protein
MNIEHLYKFIIVKILYSDSWILSRTHYGRAKCLWPGPQDQFLNNGINQAHCQGNRHDTTTHSTHSHSNLE